MLEFTCPRCLATVTAEFYGPCKSCVLTLHAEQALDQTATQLAEYVPKMNVTPNAVATKD